MLYHLLKAGIMHKALWITSALAAAAVTIGTVHFNKSSGAAVQSAPAGNTAAVAPLKISQKAKAKAPVVVEFFTSQGCSSCPPSDRLAARLARDPGILVIQRPVTYWDRLGWKDTLGKEANTSLQRAYSRRTLKGRNGVYTPQAVVSGTSGLVGSREKDLRTLISNSRAAPSAQVKIARQSDGSAEVMITGSPSPRAQVHLVGLDRSETVTISRGENGGRTLNYTNVFKGERALGSLMGGDASFMVDTDKMPIDGANAYAIIVRQNDAGPILAGHMLPQA